MGKADLSTSPIMKPDVGSTRRQVQLCLGEAGTPVGSLIYVRAGRREHTTLAYHEAWLANPAGFTVSADLQFAPGYQSHTDGSSRYVAARLIAGVGLGVRQDKLTF